MLDDSYKFCYIFPLQFILYTIIRASIIEVLTHLFRKAIWVLRHCQTAICTCNIVPEIHFLLKRSLLSFTTVTVPYLNGLFYFTQIKRVVKYLRMNNHNVFICCSFKWKQFYSMENEIHSWMSPSCVAWQFFFPVYSTMDIFFKFHHTEYFYLLQVWWSFNKVNILVDSGKTIFSEASFPLYVSQES